MEGHSYMSEVPLRGITIRYFFSPGPLAGPLIETTKFLIVREECVQTLFGKIIDANRPPLGPDLGTPERGWVLGLEPLDVGVQTVVQRAARRDFLVRERLVHALLPFFIISDSTVCCPCDLAALRWWPFFVEKFVNVSICRLGAGNYAFIGLILLEPSLAALLYQLIEGGPVRVPIQSAVSLS
jgi:hypothetical protein